jgi:hypothetical protein
VRGVVFAVVIKPSGRRCGGEREIEGQRRRCAREGGCIILVVEGEGGKGGGTLSSALASSNHASILCWREGC